MVVCLSCLQRGPNKVPVYALVAITVIALIFIFIGQVNTLGPVVTMPFMLTYAAVDYAYFALAMSFDRRSARDIAAHFPHHGELDTAAYTDDPDAKLIQANGGSTPTSPAHAYGTIDAKTKASGNIDGLFSDADQLSQRRDPHGPTGSATNHDLADVVGDPELVEGFQKSKSKGSSFSVSNQAVIIGVI